MFWEKFVKFANYSDLIRSKFGQPIIRRSVRHHKKNELFKSNSNLIHESCDYASCNGYCDGDAQQESPNLGQAQNNVLILNRFTSFSCF